MINSALRTPLLLDMERMESVRDRIATGDPALQPAWEAVRQSADDALVRPFQTVVDKVNVAPSGDPHDYVSLGTYWWPNPDTADGTPYVKRDGEVNPQTRDYDMPRWRQLARGVVSTSLAGYVTGDASYGDRATQLITAWFLDDATAMAPHMEFGQFVPGRSKGRCYGIIELAANLPMVLDVLDLLPADRSWTADHQRRLNVWLSAFLDWLLESDIGQQEDRQHNNHGVFYDRLVVALQLRLGEVEAAQRRLAEVPERRFIGQIEPDGRMPHELGRTRSWHYSLMNLAGFFGLARLGEHVGVDLWTARPAGAGGLRDAAMFLFDHVASGEAWPYKSLDVVEWGRIQPLVEIAEKHYGEPFAIERIRGRFGDANRTRLHHLTGRHAEFG